MIDCDGDEQVEQQWYGKTLQVGSVLLKITEPVERCVMVTSAQEDLPGDTRLLTTLGRMNNTTFGVYASVGLIGEVSVNDFAELVDGK